MQKKKLKLRKEVIYLFIIIVLLIICFIILFFMDKENIKESLLNNNLVGKWTSDGSTIYEFDDLKNGKLIVSLGEYPFTYEIVDNKLNISFKSDKIDNAVFKYELKENELLLTNDNNNYSFRKVGE